MQEILADLGTYGDEVNGLGYVNNANGVIYNATIFEEQGLEVPETWDEFIAVCDALQAAGITPFYGTLADSWTGIPSWNALGAYPAQDDFFDKMRAQGTDVGPDSEVSFQKNFAEMMDQQYTLYSNYMQEGYRGKTYDEGNAAFANGEVAMLLQGIWATNPIKQVESRHRDGHLPLPRNGRPRRPPARIRRRCRLHDGQEQPRSRKPRCASSTTPSRKDVIEDFAASQNMVPSVEGAEISDDPALQSVKPFFDDGKITGFIDHQIPPAVPLIPIDQEFLFNGDAEAALKSLDNEWRKVAARTIPVTTGDDQ